jgi:hypothetical protein
MTMSREFYLSRHYTQCWVVNRETTRTGCEGLTAN